MVAPFGGTRGGSGRFPYERRRRAAPPFRPAFAMSRRASARSLGLFRSFVSPFAVRVWFTVAAAIRSAVPSVRPRSLRFSLMCSYWRSRLSVQASCGMACTSLAPRLQGACSLGADGPKPRRGGIDPGRRGKGDLRERRLIQEPLRLADQPVVARLLT